MSITIHELALFRGIEPNEPGGSSYNAGEFMRVGLPFMAGCESCRASLAPYNAYPSRSGFTRCADCIVDLGYETVEEANANIFGNDDSQVDADIALLQEAFPNSEIVEG